jgi:hypothetical protein
MFGWHKTRPSADPATQVQCSFCRRVQADVDYLIAGPTVWICDACVMVCVDILNKEVHSRRDGTPAAGAGLPTDNPPETNHPRWHSLARCRLCGMPMNPDDGITVTDMGLLCRPCVTRVAAAVESPSEVERSSTND